MLIVTYVTSAPKLEVVAFVIPRTGNLRFSPLSSHPFLLTLRSRDVSSVDASHGSERESTSFSSGLSSHSLSGSSSGSSSFGCCSGSGASSSDSSSKGDLVDRYFVDTFPPMSFSYIPVSYCTKDCQFQGNRRDKQFFEFDLEIERTLTKHKNRVKFQKALQGEGQEEVSEKSFSEEFSEEKVEEEIFEEEIKNNMADNANNQRTLVDFITPATTSCGSSIVRPAVEANNFELKSSLIHIVHQD
ncbi:hypothetical protein PIB30_034984 [Stylosanthes scabra]|uniref:Uncharacterized protein n=1 Tax=Stylosanthes scabra TaxID=79078 RepID=A0ABU6QCD8_9FABA|nr:hypothetical protein [Stylosanthes scabra]